MQKKKLIALAVAGLATVPAFAQSSVTIYGIVDAGYSYRGDNIKDSVSNRSGIDSGISNGSRLGFKGTEDLGGGLKAGFVLEQGVSVDTGESGQGRTFGRQSFVNLSGGFGTVALGRQYAPQHVFQGTYDPFGKGNVGQAHNVYYSDTRLDNLLAYVSPNWGGLSVVAGYTFNAIGNESKGNNTGDTALANTSYVNAAVVNGGLGGAKGVLAGAGDIRVFAINPNYVNGPLAVGLNFHQAKLASDVLEGVDGDKVRVWDLGASYNFGVIKLAAMFGQRKGDDALGDFLFNPAFKKSTSWMLGATVPVGAAGKVLASYTQRKSELTDGAKEFYDTNKDAKANQWALGYEHSLSKRTTLYTAYSDINNKDAAKGNTDLGASVGDATSAGQGYQRGFSLGLRHVF